MEDKYPQIGLVINGPNILLSKFGISLEDILYALKDIGRIVVGKVVLNYEFSSNLLKSVIDNGLESVMVNGRVDVAVAVEGMKIIYNPRINVLALATRDAHFMPLVFEAKRMGKDVIVIAPAEKVSEALQNIADKTIELLPPKPTTFYKVKVD